MRHSCSAHFVCAQDSFAPRRALRGTRPIAFLDDGSRWCATTSAPALAPTPLPTCDGLSRVDPSARPTSAPVPALSQPPPPAPLLFEHIFSLSLACAGVPPAGPRTVNLVGACCLLVGHKAPNECSSHGLPRTCTCRGLETHSSVNIQCCHGVESQRELSDMSRPLSATVPVIEPKYGGPLEDTRRFLSPLPPRAPRTRMTPPPENTIKHPHVSLYVPERSVTFW